ncbi:MAG TPA: metal-sensitive transcriptional regulator [Thermomicrobiales bacterium]|nr:metal-sensitive transcriptional regulator [Thermomicrobiales bacterium]
MASISELPTNARADLTARLKRIEGQARGIQKMLEDGRDCSDVINQISAIKAATNALSVEALEAFALYCFTKAADSDHPEQAVSEAVRALVRAGR